MIWYCSAISRRGLHFLVSISRISGTIIIVIISGHFFLDFLWFFIWLWRSFRSALMIIMILIVIFMVFMNWDHTTFSFFLNSIEVHLLPTTLNLSHIILIIIIIVLWHVRSTIISLLWIILVIVILIVFWDLKLLLLLIFLIHALLVRTIIIIMIHTLIIIHRHTLNRLGVLILLWRLSLLIVLLHFRVFYMLVCYLIRHLLCVHLWRKIIIHIVNSLIIFRTSYWITLIHYDLIGKNIYFLFFLYFWIL